MITEDYVSFEIAKLLKEKGFDEKCVAYYPQCIIPIKLTFGGRVNYNASNKFKMLPPISAPTHQMARRWLRKVHNIFISINLTLTEEPDEYPPMYYVYIHDTKTGKLLIKYDETNLLVDENKQPRCFVEPEQAVDVALKYILENLI